MPRVDCAASKCEEAANDTGLICQDHWVKLPEDTRMRIHAARRLMAGRELGAAQKYLVACQIAIWQASGLPTEDLTSGGDP